MNLTELCKTSHAVAVEKGWYEQERKLPELLMLVVSELAEALEDYRGGYGCNETYYEGQGKPCGIPTEIADAVIRIGDLCGAFGIDLEKAVTEKMAYNLHRPHRHGGKVA